MMRQVHRNIKTDRERDIQIKGYRQTDKETGT